MCHVLLLATGAQIAAYSHTGDFDEFVVSHKPLWRPRDAAVRIFYRRVLTADLSELEEYGRQIDAAELIAIAPHGAEEPVTAPSPIHLISAAELIDRLVKTPLIEWQDSTPAASVDRLEFFMQLVEAAGVLDPIGIQWLPQLALNESPVDLTDVDTSPQDLLERKAFRIFTAAFRFGGVRYGEAARGERLPDAVLYWPDGSPTAALLDCKAASKGYRMEADHLLRFQEYWDRLQAETRDEDHELEYLIILSSFFPGVEGDRHPYYGRAEEIKDRTGLHLVYLQASDLSWAAVQVEAADIPPAKREALDWRSVLDAGLVNSAALTRAVQLVL